MLLSGAGLDHFVDVKAHCVRVARLARLEPANSPSAPVSFVISEMMAPRVIVSFRPACALKYALATAGATGQLGWISDAECRVAGIFAPAEAPAAANPATRAASAMPFMRLSSCLMVESQHSLCNFRTPDSEFSPLYLACKLFR